MLQVLAQVGGDTGARDAATTTSGTAVVTGTKEAAGPQGRWPTGTETLHGVSTAGGILILGLIVFVLFRKYLVRAKLGVALLVLAATLAVYFGGLATVPVSERPVVLALGLERWVKAGLLFVALCLVNRLVLVPVLTRGGKVTLPKFVHQMILIVGLLFATLGYGAHEFEWDITNFLAGSAVVSIVLGLALQETLGNFFSGLVMQTSSPFAVGHWIKVLEVEGRVVDMTWRAVTLQTDYDDFVHIPNSTMAREQITNYNTPTTATAKTILVGIQYDIPPEEAIRVLKAAAMETPGVSAHPAPYVYLENFGESSIDYRIRFWITDPPEDDEIQSAVRVNVWYRLKQNNMGIPFPIRTTEVVNMDRRERRQQESAAATRLCAIQKVPLFAALSSGELKMLAESSRDVLLAANQILFRQNDAGDSFYIIRHGTADVIVRGEAGTEKTLATLGPGEYFGEMSGLTGQPRSATIKAASGLVCVEIGRSELHQLFTANVKLLESVSEVIGKRAAERTAALANLSAAAKASAVAEQQKSVLGRMMRFFGLG